MSDHIEYGTTGEHHPYHLVRPSVWPMVGAFAGGLFALGMVLFMHDVEIGGMKPGLWAPLVGVLSILAVMFFWWKDVIFESVTEGVHNKITEKGLRMGMALFIASEVMFFVAFFWAFFDVSVFADEAIQYLRVEYTQGVWPPPMIHAVPPFDLPFLMTMILLLSGTTVTWAHHAILKGNQKSATEALIYTVLLGVIFLGMQVFEYMHAHFGFTEGSFASTFYMATGFHGFHVFVGTIFLGVCLVRNMKGHFKPDRHFGFEAAAWYWHFVDVVWLFLFIAVYVWGGTIGIGDHETAAAAYEAANAGGE
ncbi:MAG TPA: cytochrome c oxidase subunit 3 [Alphaproteobacteria bacterium]|nr:cytochrome c oxidase subunit 3 [Alphaproteobacteria bacterium]HOO51503.1 cytochrome c oxidase subunit 3 [Alphaproteobacteria bacterium]